MTSIARNVLRLALIAGSVLYVGAHGSARAAGADQVHLRNGDVIQGTVAPGRRDAYTFTDARTHEVRTISKHEVRFVVYDPERSIETQLHLDDIRSLCDDPGPVTADFFPTESFGEQLVDAAERAQVSIWILAYYLSGSYQEPISTFYQTLRSKARDGVDVVLVTPFGSGTESTVKETTMNFADELRRDGVTVLYVQESKVQHKKLIIIDGHTVLLGSSNLTTSGVRKNNEMNVRIAHPSFTEEAIQDFQELRDKALPAEELSY